MVLNWIETVLFGLFSGLFAHLPVSSSGHRIVMQHLFGVHSLDPLTSLFLDLGTLAAVLFCSSGQLHRLLLDRTSNTHRSGLHASHSKRYDYRLLHMAIFPILIAQLLFSAENITVNLLFLSITFLFNGILLFVSSHMRQGNKDSRRMTGIDGLFIGLFGALSALPGISAVGTVLCAGTVRGAGRHHALNWGLLLLAPIFLLRVLLDLAALILYGSAISVGLVLCSVFAGILAFVGGWAGYRIVRFLAFHTGFSGFAYYSWGAALLSFILFLIT